MQPDDAFCPTCGAPASAPALSAPADPGPPAPVGDEAEPAPANPYHHPKAKKPRPEANPKRKSRVVVGAVSGVVSLGVITGGVIGYTAWNSPVNQASRYISEDKYDQAYDMYAKAEDQSAFTNKLTNALNEQLDALKKDFTNGKISYDDAQVALGEIGRFGFSGVQSHLADVTSYIDTMNQSHESYTQGMDALSQQDYSGAIHYLPAVVPDDPNYQSAVDSLKQAVDGCVSQALADSSQLASAGDYKGAMAKLNSALAIVGPVAKQNEGQALQDKLDEYKGPFISKTLDEAETYRSQQDYGSAIDAVEAAIAIVPDASLSAELSKLQAERPIPLAELTLSESDNYTQITDLTVTTDVTGANFSPDNLFEISARADSWGSGFSGYADYYLSKGYTELTGTVAVANTSDTTSAVLTVYGDKKILYTSSTLSRTTAPFDLKIDLTKVDWLEFKLVQTDDAADGTLNVLLSGLQFTK